MLNPVLRREVRTMLRTWRTFIFMSIYILCLTLVAGLCLLVIGGGSIYNGFNPRDAVNVYRVLLGTQLGFILLIVPTIAGSAISGERERQTLDLMLVTKMTTVSIVLGKLISSIILILLMVVAAIPVFGIFLYYGGVSVWEFFIMTAFYMVTAAMVGSVSIFFSTTHRKSIAATVLTYILVMVLSIGTFMIVVIFGEVWDSIFDYSLMSPNLVFGILSFNPFMGFISILDPQLGGDVVESLIESISYSNRTLHFPIPMWVFHIGLDIIITAIFIFLSSTAIKPAGNTIGNRRKK